MQCKQVEKNSFIPTVGIAKVNSLIQSGSWQGAIVLQIGALVKVWVALTYPYKYEERRLGNELRQNNWFHSDL